MINITHTIENACGKQAQPHQKTKRFYSKHVIMGGFARLIIWAGSFKKRITPFKCLRYITKKTIL